MGPFFVVICMLPVRRKGKECDDQIREAWDNYVSEQDTRVQKRARVAYQALYLIFIQRRHGGLLRNGRKGRWIWLSRLRYHATMKMSGSSSWTAGGAC